MNRYRGVALLLWIGSAVTMGLALLSWATVIPAAPSIAPAWTTTGVPDAPDSAALVAALDDVRARNPFRLDRTPTGVRFDPEGRAPLEAVPVTRAPRPILTLAGIVGGPPWNALIEGIPGHESGALLRAGDERSGIRVVTIRADTVVLAGRDTTWTLTPRRMWP